MSLPKKLFNSTLMAVLIIAILSVSAVSACPSQNVSVKVDCDNVTVTANPETKNVDTSGNTRSKWVPETPVGTGIFPWAPLQTQMSGKVTITWYLWKSDWYGWDGTWYKTSQTDIGTTNWSKSRPNNCKITICHVAGRADDPANYVTMTISINGALGHFYENGTQRSGHEDDSLGACVPPVVTNTASLSFVNDCDGYNVTAIASSGGSISGNISGVWTDPYDIEDPIPAGNVVVTWTSGNPLSITLPYESFVEPENCLVVLDHSAKITTDSDCDRFWSDIVPSDGGVVTPLVTSGSWVFPLIREKAEVSYTVTWPDGFVKTFYETIHEKEICVKDEPYAYITLGECTYTKEDGSLTPVMFEGKGIIYTLLNKEYLPGDVAYLPKGVYTIPFVVQDGFFGEGGSISVNTESCYVKPIRKTCPTCDYHKDEVPSKDHNIVYAKGSQDCYDCFTGKNYGYIVEGSYSFALRDIPFKALVSVSEKTLKDAGVPYVVDYDNKHKIKKVFISAVPFEGLDKTYYRIILPRELTHNFMKFYEMDGTPIPDWGKDSQVDKFVPCSLSYGEWFVQSDGIMTLPVELNISDWDIDAWLVSAGYFPDTVEGWAAAQKWLVPSVEEWKEILKSGIIGPLPPKQ